MLPVMTLSILGPALEPAQSWLAKEVLDGLTKKGAVLRRGDLPVFVPLVLGVLAVLAGISLLGHLLDKILDAKLKIDFQRFYFDRHLRYHAGEDISRTFNDCEQARKMVDILQRDIWVIVIGLPSVLIWQMHLASGWVVPLIVATLPSLLFTVLLGPFVRRWSRRRLEAMAGISGAVCDVDRPRLHRSQRVYYRSSVWFELTKKSAEVLTDFILWTGLAVVLLFSWMLPILPEQVYAGDLAAFVVNIRLLGKPLREVGKLYVKVHESHPAVLRIFTPAPLLQEVW